MRYPYPGPHALTRTVHYGRYARVIRLESHFLVEITSLSKELHMPTNMEPAFCVEIDGVSRYRSAATLADDPAGLTCSVTVGLEWAAHGRAGALLGYPTFEAAAKEVKAGKHDALLVAGAYPEIRSFFFDPALRAVEAFVAPLPDIVLAAPAHNAKQSTEFTKLYYHPATYKLLESLDRVSLMETEQVTSNSLACRRATDDSGHAVAITNATCAEHYGLNVIDVLSAGTPMSFVVFERGRLRGRTFAGYRSPGESHPQAQGVRKIEV
ncbi:hypothetical protein AB0K35_33965 [Micromonospora sp. NPDC053740]|uniref:hypothetical protein n=1 Tax=Micromonospora sp. NPDC053740 TaxID=3155173 RepID=UPI003427D9CD